MKFKADFVCIKFDYSMLYKNMFFSFESEKRKKLFLFRNIYLSITLKNNLLRKIF